MNGELFKTTPTGDATPHSKSFTAVQLTMQFGLGVLLLWWIITWVNLDGEQLVQVFTQASFFPLILAALCFTISMVLKALQYQIFLRSTSGVYLIGIALSQNALLTFLPWRIGEMSFPLLLRKDYNIPITSSVSLLLVIRLVDLLIVVTVALVGSRKLGLDIHRAAVIFSVVAAVGLLFALNFALRNLAIGSLQTFTATLEPLRNALHFGSFLLLSVSIFTLTTLQSTFALQAMGLAVTLPDIALLNALSLLAALLPIHPPGGWGTIDSIQVVVLKHLNYYPGTAVPVILATHCFYTLLILVGGIIGWVLRGKACFR